MGIAPFERQNAGRLAAVAKEAERLRKRFLRSLLVFYQDIDSPVNHLPGTESAAGASRSGLGA
jgi:hypothetical protein